MTPLTRRGAWFLNADAVRELRPFSWLLETLRHTLWPLTFPRPRSTKRVSELRLADTEISSPNRQTCSSFPLPRGTSIMFFCASCSNTWPSQTQLFPEPLTESCGARERLPRLKVNHRSWFGYPQTPESS